MDLQQRIGRYQIVRLIGRGGAGAVYEAIDPSLARRVAVKTITLGSPEEGERLRDQLVREASLTALLDHPNIVSVYDVGEREQVAYLVMEYVPGKTLESLIQSSEASRWPQFLPLLGPCADALDYAHGMGVVHRDVKPGNIMVKDDGTPKILDFGLARLAYHSAVTQQGSIMGTLSYLSPEVVLGNPPGPTSDQFSLAVIAYRLVTGVFPFGGESSGSVLYKIVNEPPVQADRVNPSVTLAVAQALERALSKNPALRFSKCAEFVEAVQQPFATRAQAPAAPSKSGAFSFVTDIFNNFFGPPRPQPAPPPVPPPAPAHIESSQTQILRRPTDSRLPLGELARLQTDELIQALDQEAFERVLALEGTWLPGVDGAEPPLLAFRETARYLLSARNSSSTHNAVEHLARAEAVLVTAGNQLLQDRSPLAVHLPKALEAWKDFTRARLREGRDRLASQLPNPFRAGQPLRPDQGRSVFRGREEIVKRIEAILADANQSGSIALLGPRRCGKTSLLQMLPCLLPDCVCIFFDLQDNPVDSTQSFFEALDRQAREQARRDRRIELPALPSGPIFAVASDWFQALDTVAGDSRILLCIDEFERLEDLFPGNRQDLLRLMGLFRATIQHRRKLRLLVSGVAPFEELGQIWNDHFINVREVRVGHLDRAASLDLLMRPLPDFPAAAVPEEVASEVFKRTGGQPYLLQLYGSLLIARLNAEGRSQAALTDIAVVEEEAMSQAAYYFRHTYEAAPAEARDALEALAAGQRPVMPPAVRRWLSSRGLLDDNDSLFIPVLGTFMHEELGLADRP